MINPDELLFSVDEDNNPIEPQPRALSHKTGIWHRAVHVWIVNSDGEILCQQRSLLKDSNPGLWEPFFGGHLGPDQTYENAAVKEVTEELGIRVQPDALLPFAEFKYEKGTEFQAIFVLKQDVSISQLHLEKEEVEQVAWRSIEDIVSSVAELRDPEWTYIGYEQDLLDWLQEQF